MSAVAPALDFGGPVSTALEANLRDVVRRHGLVVWLDGDARYRSFVERLSEARAAGAIPYEVCAFSGSYLALLLALESHTAGASKPALVLYLPGLNTETVQQTPLLEVYESATNYPKKLETLVADAAAGQVGAGRIAAFVAQPGLTLEAADVWLARCLAESDDSLAGRLRTRGLPGLLDDLLDRRTGTGLLGGPLAGALAEPGGQDALWSHLAAAMGVPVEWRRATLPAQPQAQDLAFAAASWALCVEYVHDLQRPPVNTRLLAATGLPGAVVETCRSLASHLRERHEHFYQRTADETELLLDDEVRAARAEDLGRIDTFRFEEDRVLVAALDALDGARWDAAAGWAEPRVAGRTASASFWLRADPTRLSAWQLVLSAAHLGQAILEAGEALAGARQGALRSVDEALDRYVARGAAVDRAHRHLEQRRAALLYPQLPDFERLRACLDGLRTAWRRWADAWASDFAAVCRAHGGLPDPDRQQRAIFDTVVRPLTQEPGVTALFVVDGFRYEMGEELRAQLADTPATQVQLRARLAELPTVTEVGMNVLAPVAVNGRLRPVLSDGDGGFLGFSTGEYRVSDPASRQRAMHARAGGQDCPWLTLDEATRRDAASLKRAIARAKLVVVHSQESTRSASAAAGRRSSTRCCRSCGRRGRCCARPACAASSSRPTMASCSSTSRRHLPRPTAAVSIPATGTSSRPRPPTIRASCAWRSPISATTASRRSS